MRQFFNAILSSLLAFLGIGCSHSLIGGEWGGGGVVCMYGVPTATYQVQGTVQSEEGTPLKNIQVVHSPERYKENLKYCPTREDSLQAEEYYTVRTDSLGHFVLRTDDGEWPVDSLDVEFNDTDGPENGGEFLSAATKLKLTYQRPDNYNGWYEGVGSAETTVTLTRKPE